MENCEPMTAEQTKKAEIINDRLNALSIEVKSSLACMLEINSIALEPMGIPEGKKSNKDSRGGWFNNVIDMLIHIHNNNHKLKVELERLRKEFKK